MKRNPTIFFKGYIKYKCDYTKNQQSECEI